MNLNLSKLRNKIDKIDNKIFNLICKRLKIAEKIGIIKNKNKISYYIPERENEILNLKIKENINKGISDKTTQGVLKKIIYESYIKEINNKLNKKNKKNNLIKIVFIGGKGKMGIIFKNIFSIYNYNVLELNSKDWLNAKNILNNSKVVIICSPISKLNKILNKLNIYLSKECILLDITSIKKIPIKKMLSIHSGPVLGLHPMFGSNIRNLTKQIIVYCDGRYPEKYKWILDQFKLWGIILVYMSYDDHDKYMSYVQSLRYFNCFSMGLFLMNENININKLIKISPPIYQIYLSIIGKFFSGDLNLYLEILFSSKNNISIINRYLNNIKKIINILKYKNKEKIPYLYKKIKLWFNLNINKLSNVNDLLSEEIIINK